MRVLLIAAALPRPVVSGDYRDKIGCLYLVAALNKQGIEVCFVDMHVDKLSLKDLAKKIKVLHPQVIGLSCVTDSYYSAIDCARVSKEILPESLVVAGGPHVSMAVEDTLSHVPQIDVIVRGEGEETFLELIQRHEKKESFDSIQGISYRVDDEIINNPSRSWIEDLDSIPFPAREITPKFKNRIYSQYTYNERYPGSKDVNLATVIFITSRGCPYNCIFCSSCKFWGKKYRVRSPENVIKELEFISHEYGVKKIEFSDDDFAINKKRAKQICQLMIDRKIDIKWNTHIRVDNVNKELLSLMKEAGCYYVSYGVESGSQKILDKVIEKRITLDQVRDVTRWCRELGIKRHANFMISFPEETIEDAQKTMDFMKELGGKINLGVSFILPGTRLEKVAKEKKLLPKDFSWSKKYDYKYSFPSMVQAAPYFVEILPWKYIQNFVFNWASQQHYSFFGHIKRALKNIRSLKDIFRLMNLYIEFIRARFKKVR